MVCSCFGVLNWCKGNKNLEPSSQAQVKFASCASLVKFFAEIGVVCSDSVLY
ncbi:hypothetical protein RchiOBHm_Chr4g0393681 [Rosa chinensis]|uniref:Uncharacterized protein n=1 Tax=Rosa chinensis TaxID=74649 RepID=A0A2P6QR13_ROSCH|nr:hypothetical protein RchiOBHm_Chr4g0393681 [Rosa chinensis]